MIKKDRIIYLIYFIGLTLLFFNDWVWKYQYHNWFTGKLSDFTGLMIFPIFVSLLFPKFKKQIVYATGIGFIIWKTPIVDGIIDFWNTYFFTIQRVVDYSDYIALIVLPLSYKIINSDGFDQLVENIKIKSSLIKQSSFLIISLFVFSSTSKFRPNYPAGDILIQSSYKIELPKQYVLEKLEELNLTVNIDSIYAGENEMMNRPYYQIPILKYDKYGEADSIMDINFYLFEDHNLDCQMTIINISIQEDWELQDWKKLKSLKKYFSEVLEDELIDKLQFP